MATESFSNLIRWFIIVVLIVAAIFNLGIWDYAVAIALIYLILRTPLTYTKPKRK